MPLKIVEVSTAFDGDWNSYFSRGCHVVLHASVLSVVILDDENVFLLIHELPRGDLLQSGSLEYVQYVQERPMQLHMLVEGQAAKILAMLG